ncbi:MAG: arsenate reductase ArsC [Ignavibacteriae bacterium]|nr:MAG: arsenate reductase ArsC [Ignavibacteriota bacterium]
MMKRFLILCTGNSCRSQMAEGYLKSFDKELEVYSAGTKPAAKVNPNSVKVMEEIGIDISSQNPQDVNEFIDESFDYVITVCDNAKEICPVFNGEVKQQLHLPFEDPADATGTEEEVLAVYRKVRDEIKEKFTQFFNQKNSSKLASG